MATAKKKILKKKKTSNGTNVRITDSNFILIRDFCKEKGYKIGTFVENAALKRIVMETHER